jgi:hypothetical protein
MLDVDEKLVVWYTPAAIREHYDGHPDDPTRGLSDEQLAEAGQDAIADERTWETFGSVLETALAGSGVRYWVREVANGDTKLGYAEWCHEKKAKGVN